MHDTLVHISLLKEGRVRKVKLLKVLGLCSVACAIAICVWVAYVSTTVPRDSYDPYGY